VNADTDARILAELRALHELLDPTPPEVLAGARAAFSRRDVDSELAELISDSLFDPAGSRSALGPRLLTFATARVTVELQVAVHGDRIQLLGQVVPTGPGIVAARSGGERITGPVDEVGCFRFDDLPRGPLSVQYRAAGVRPVTTDWIVI